MDAHFFNVCTLFFPSITFSVQHGDAYMQHGPPSLDRSQSNKLQINPTTPTFSSCLSSTNMHSSFPFPLPLSQIYIIYGLSPPLLTALPRFSPPSVLLSPPAAPLPSSCLLIPLLPHFLQIAPAQSLRRSRGTSETEGRK